MDCAWQGFINLLPAWIRKDADRLGRETLQELRLRMDRPPELVFQNKSLLLQKNVTADDLHFCVNAASQYSPWTSATSAEGYITAPGGHRLGICGNVVVKDGKIVTIKNFTSLCIRIARNFCGISDDLAGIQESMLIIGSPGRGKTTLLRDIVQKKSAAGRGAVGVVDERMELFPMYGGGFCFPPGARTEVISGCSKSQGIEILIRTMNPRWIAVDEITAAADCQAIIHSAYCGVSFLATAHAETMDDLLGRPVYRPLMESNIFKSVIILQPDKSWRLERMNV